MNSDQISSSMKYMDLTGLSPLQIIQNYEKLLFERENQIIQFKQQLNDSENNIDNTEKIIDSLRIETQKLIERKKDYEKLCEYNKKDRDALFNRLNNLIAENDKLKNKNIIEISANNELDKKEEPKINIVNKDNKIEEINKKEDSEFHSKSDTKLININNENKNLEKKGHRRHHEKKSRSRKLMSDKIVYDPVFQ